MDSGYNKSRLTRQRTQKRTQQRTKRGRVAGSKNRATIERELKAERAALPGGKIAVEVMDDEIAHFEKLMKTLYPWDKDGVQIKTKSVQAYYWASEMRRDYVQMRAPYQSPRLSSVQVIPAGQSNRRETTVNVTILNERGEQEYTDAPQESAPTDAAMKLIEGTVEADNPDDKPDDSSDEAA